MSSWKTASPVSLSLSLSLFLSFIPKTLSYLSLLIIKFIHLSHSHSHTPKYTHALSHIHTHTHLNIHSLTHRDRCWVSSPERVCRYYGQHGQTLSFPNQTSPSEEFFNESPFSKWGPRGESWLGVCRMCVKDACRWCDRYMIDVWKMCVMCVW